MHFRVQWGPQWGPVRDYLHAPCTYGWYPPKKKKHNFMTPSIWNSKNHAKCWHRQYYSLYSYLSDNTPESVKLFSTLNGFSNTIITSKLLQNVWTKIPKWALVHVLCHNIFLVNHVSGQEKSLVQCEMNVIERIDTFEKGHADTLLQYWSLSN